MQWSYGIKTPQFTAGMVCGIRDWVSHSPFLLVTPAVLSSPSTDVQIMLVGMP